MVGIPIIAGVYTQYKKISERWLNCSSCGRPNDLEFSIEKKAGYFFFIPLIPLGLSTYIECPICKKKEIIIDAPRDWSWVIFLILSILCILLAIISPFILMNYIDPFMLGILLFLIIGGII